MKLRHIASSVLALLIIATFTQCTTQKHWVGTWGTAGQLVEPHNNPPAPGLGGNTIRQIVQVSIGGENVRLQLTNEFSKEPTEIIAIELAHATTAGSSSATNPFINLILPPF